MAVRWIGGKGGGLSSDPVLAPSSDTGGKGGGGGRGISKSGGGGSSSPSNTLAQITNEDFAIYEEDFLPVEEQLIADITDPDSGNNAADQALADTLKGFDRQKSVLDRNLGRSGTKITSAQGAKVDSARGLGRTTAGIGAANLARRNQDASNDNTITQMVQAGQTLRGVSLQGLGAASNMENQREQAGAALKAQAQGQAMSNIGTGAGLGFMMMGGPAGAAVGAGIGLLTSLF